MNRRQFISATALAATASLTTESQAKEPILRLNTIEKLVIIKHHTNFDMKGALWAGRYNGEIRLNCPVCDNYETWFRVDTQIDECGVFCPPHPCPNCNFNRAMILLDASVPSYSKFSQEAKDFIEKRTDKLLQNAESLDHLREE